MTRPAHQPLHDREGSVVTTVVAGSARERTNLAPARVSRVRVSAGCPDRPLVP